MASQDLISLATFKAYYGGSPPTQNDGRIQTLITSMSRTMLSKLSRPSILPRLYTERRDGNPRGIMLRRWPVVSIQSVSVLWPSLRTIAAAPDPCSGYLLDGDDTSSDGGPGAPQFLYGPFPQGEDNLSIAYVAGYQVTAEAATVPTSDSFALEVEQPYGAWASDEGVTYADGVTPLELVTAGGPPAQGQYAIGGCGTYGFSPVDAGAGVLISYGYVPADLSNALIEWIADRLAYAGRVGVRSQSAGGQETTGYNIVDIPVFVKSVLQDYMSVIPIN